MQNVDCVDTTRSQAFIAPVIVRTRTLDLSICRIYIAIYRDYISRSCLPINDDYFSNISSVLFFSDKEHD